MKGVMTVPDYNRLYSLVARVNYPGLSFTVGYDDGSLQPWLQVYQPEGKCSVTGKAAEQKGRKWRLSPHMGDGEVIQTAFMAVMAFNEHEARENFKLDGAAVFQPHFDIYALVRFTRSNDGEAVGRSERD